MAKFFTFLKKGRKTTSLEEWIEEKIKNEYVHRFEYNEFSQIIEIGSGAFGKVSKANFANRGLVALKTISKNSEEKFNETNDEFVKELKLLREVDYHPNINRILGIAKDSKHYMLVLEYANEGNLRDYLEKNSTLKWDYKIQMALDITSGLKFLHSKEIIHRDLHSKNILVNNGKLLIADLGLSKKWTEISTNSIANKMGMVEYIEPQCFKKANIGYKKDKKSDIYSLGVLLWEISSGRPPFLGHSRDILAFHISHNNLREDPIEDTPLEYQLLYQECWNGDPEPRPDIEKVYENLSQLNTKDSFDLQSQQLIINESNLNVSNDYYNLFTIPDYLNLNSRNQLVEGGENGKVRNLLIIGRTLSGKTTLSSVLCDTDDFRENGNTINETKNLRKKDFEWKGTKYYVIEIGVGSIKKKDFYNEIIELMPEGISQVLFVADKSFTAEEKKTLELYKKIIFETGILEFVTIVRNKFENFRNKNECEKDKKYVFEENGIITKIVKLCNNIIHIDNPPPTYIYDDNDYEGQIAVNGNAREESRTILLSYLEVCREKYYKLEKWDDLHSKIAITISIAQQWFNEKYLEKESINIAEGKKSEEFENTEGKRSEESQKEFDKKYLRKENIEIAKGKKLKLRGSLKIIRFEKLKKISLKKFELTNLEIIRCFQLDKVDLSKLFMLKN